MPSRCGPPQFDQQDWSAFDFSRWHLDGVQLEAGAAVFAGLSDRLFNSEEWREHFQAVLPELQKGALEFFTDNSQQLRDEKDRVARDFDERIAAARRRGTDFQKAAGYTAGPPVGQPIPGSFQLLARVTSEAGGLGLPGISVRIMDPRNEDQALVEAVTDLAGNAVLTVPRDIAAQLDKRDAALQLLGAGGKVLLASPAVVCMRLGQAETKVLALPDSPETQAGQQAAAAIQAERETRLATLSAQVETLNREREARLAELDCSLADNEAIVADLETGRDASPPGRPQGNP